MGKYESKKKYSHFVPYARPVANWYSKYNFVLVTSIEQLNKIFDDMHWEPGKFFLAFDTETTGLDFELLNLVGYSFCIDGVSTYYVPVNHFDYENNLGDEACDIIYQKMLEARLVFMYNAQYDMEVFEYIGYKEHKEELDKKRWLYVKYDMSKVKVFDVMNSVFDSDTNDKMPSLKESSLRFLGYEQMHFDEVIESAGNFYYLNPSENTNVVYYAGADALCTYLLVPATIKYYRESRMAGEMDNLVLYPLAHYKAEKLWLDLPRLQRMTEECSVELERLESEVYKSLGTVINLNSPVQVSQALERLGIDTGERTETGNMKTGMDELQALPEDVKAKFPALQAFIRYKEVAKLHSTYFKVFLKEAENKGFLRASYKIHNVPCLTESANVNVKSKGIISIKDVEVGDEIWTQYGYKKVLWNNRKWSDNVFTLNLKCGSSITGTGHHPILVNNNGSLRNPKPVWTSIEYLKKEETVIMNSHRPDINFDHAVSLPKIECTGYKVKVLPSFMSVDLARLLGYMDGDGHIMSDGIRMSFNTNEPEVINFYTHLMERVFPGLGKPCIEVVGNSTTYNYFSVDVSNFFRSINSRQCIKDEVCTYIKTSSSGYWVEYLIGLWDTDGSMCIQTNKKNRNFFSPRVKTIKKGMMRDVNYMLQFLGVTTRMLVFPGEDNSKTQYEVRCDTFRGHDKFREIIGNNLIHNVRRERSIINEIDPYYDLFQSRVKEVIDEGHGDWVYDIEVEEVHEYIANGIVTHNTGRFSAGKDGKNTFYSPVNIQAMPKPHVAMYDVYDYGEPYRNYFSKKDNVIMGYAFVKAIYDNDGNHIVPTDPRYIGWAEGMNPELNIRSCITPKMYKDSGEEEFIYVACDYSAQELRITANMSHEPVWEKAFVEGRDVHRSTAEEVWGKENYNKDYRKMAKGVNFCSGEDNLILVKDKGYIPAKEISIGDDLIPFQVSESNKVTNIQKVNNQRCYTLYFTNGIKATYREGHSLLCSDINTNKQEWVKVENIVDDIDKYFIITMHNGDICEKFKDNDNIFTSSQKRIDEYITEKSTYYSSETSVIKSDTQEDLVQIALLANYIGRAVTYVDFDTCELRMSNKIIPSQFSLTKVVRYSETLGNIVAIECETHEYVDMSMISHNSVIYGASAASFNDPYYGIHSLAEAEEFYNNYKSKLPTLFQWIDRKQRKARKDGTVYTYFGRPRRVKGYYDIGSTGFANRTVINTQIQGCHVYDNKVLTNKGYIKIGKLYDEFKNIHEDMDKWDYKVWNGMKWCDFFPVERGKDIKYRLHFDNGQIVECDSRHQVKIFGNDSIHWKDVKSLSCNEDYVCFMKNTDETCSEVRYSKVIGNSHEASRKYNSDIVFDREDIKVMCYIYGSILGDGHIGYGVSRNGFRSKERAGFNIVYGGNAKKKVNIGLIKYFLSKKGIDFRDKYNPNHISKSGKVSPVGDLSCDCYPLVDAIHKLTGDIGGNVYTKRIGDRVFTFDRELVHCVLRGIYDSDGIAISGGVHLVNEGLIRDIQLLMKYFGYDSYIRKSEGAENSSDSYTVVPHNYGFNYREELLGRSKYDGSWQFSTLPYHSYMLKEYSVSASQVGGSSNWTVFNRVKAGGSCEIRTYRMLFERMNNLDYSIDIGEDYDYHIITKVENTNEKVNTYTLCVLDESHQYVCEGMISHNTAADILKLVMIRLWRNVFTNPYYNEDVRFMLTIHDEIGYSVRCSRLNEIMGVIEDNQTVILEGWPVPIITEASCGWSVGELFAWERVYDTEDKSKWHYIPKLD